ncbi:cilia- and flagella-associated protein 44-like [Babylonia areolata]|uniref:cilia- and flagella-associated protein 44-like n=1 Tax=Babylonia areolata TaxID=304850 RepID=UPI003FD09113
MELPPSPHQPGGQFQLTPDMEHQLKLEAQDKRRQHQQQEILSRQQETHISPFNKTHRKSSVAIAMERRLSNKSQEVISHEQSTMPHSAAAMPKSGWWTTRGEAGGADEMQLSSGMGDSDDTTLFHSSLREELKAVEQIKLKYMQSVLMKEIEVGGMRVVWRGVEKTRIFDIHHRMLRHEKFEVDVLVKAGQIRVTTLQEEQLLLVDCEHVEEEIQSRIDNCLDQRSEMDRVLKQTQAQVSKLTKEIEESAKKEKTLFTQLDTIIGENNQFRDYLIKVFKKKVKRKVAKSSDDESDSSESDSDSSDDDDDSEDDDENAVYLDPNICPDNCSEEIYNQVISLRGERLDNDDQAAELKKNREALVKDIDSTTKKRQGMDGTLSKTENELHAFQLEKQKRVNDLDTVCTIQLHQIQCLRRREFKAITNELILSEHELIRLQNRISELKVEKKEEKMKSVERRKLHSRLEYERTLFLDKLAQMEETCKKEMVDKFGKIVDMAVVETVVADPQIEDVRVRLLRAQQDSDKELMTCVRKISDLKRTNDHSLKLDSEYKYVEADMKEKIMDMEKEINDSMGTAIKNCLPQDFSKLPKDVHALMDVVAKQSEILKGLRMEIDCLQGRLRPPPPPKK